SRSRSRGSSWRRMLPISTSTSGANMNLNTSVSAELQIWLVGAVAAERLEPALDAIRQIARADVRLPLHQRGDGPQQGPEPLRIERRRRVQLRRDKLPRDKLRRCQLCCELRWKRFGYPSQHQAANRLQVSRTQATRPGPN